MHSRHLSDNLAATRRPKILICDAAFPAATILGKPGKGVGFGWHQGNGGILQSSSAMPVDLAQGRRPIPLPGFTQLGNDPESG